MTGDPNGDPDHEFPDCEPVRAFRAYEVYADYDGNAPDTAGLIFVSDPDLALRVCDALNADTDAFENLAFSDGNEWCKRFAWRETLRATTDDVHRTFRNAMAAAHEDHEVFVTVRLARGGEETYVYNWIDAVPAAPGEVSSEAELTDHYVHDLRPGMIVSDDGVLVEVVKVSLSDEDDAPQIAPLVP